MKLTPMDIHQQEFRHSLRGYAEDEVDTFLDKVADEFERLFKENIDLAERLERAQQQLAAYDAQKDTLHNTMIAAQRATEEMALKARNEAEGIVRDADQKAKELIHNALQKKQVVANELVRIKTAEEEFRARYKGLLETHLKSVSEIALPSDVSVLLGETDEGVIGDVAVAPQVSAPTPEPMVPPVSQATVAMPPVEPPASGFVSSVTLGENGAAGAAGDEDGEGFDFGNFDVFGEREDDPDIEEID